MRHLMLRMNCKHNSLQNGQMVKWVNNLTYVLLMDAKYTIYDCFGRINELLFNCLDFHECLG